MIRHILSTLAAAALLTCAPAFGTTFTSTWNGGTGNWSTAADWTPATVPNDGGGNTYNVTIASGASGGDSVSLDTSPTIDSLVVGGASTSSALVDQNGIAHSLTVTGPLTVNTNGSLSLNSSRVSVGASSSNAGSVLVGAGGPPTSQTSSTLNISGDLTNTGSIGVGVGGAPLGMAGPSGTLNVTGTLTNHGGLSIEGTRSTPLGVSYGATASLGALVNNGGIFVDGGTLNVANGITDLPSGSSLSVFGTINSGGSQALAGLTNIAGSLELQNQQSTTITPNGGTLTVSGRIGIEAVPAAVGPSVTPSAVTVNGALVLEAGADVETSGGSSLTVANGITDIPAGAVLSLGGPVNIGGTGAMVGLTSVEGTLSFIGAGTTITPNGGTLTVSGNLSVSPGVLPSGGLAPGGAVVVNGTLVVANGGTINIGALFSTVQATNGIVNNGTTTVAAGGSVFSPSTINNASFSIASGGFVTTDFTNSASATLTLAGSIIRAGPTYPSGPFTNAGTLAEVLSGAPASNNTCTGSGNCGFINVGGTATLGGTLHPILTNGFDPTNGESFIFLTAGSVNGQFSSIENIEFNNDSQYWIVTYGSDYVELTAEAVPEPATLLLFGVGLTALGAAAWFGRKNRRST